MVLLRVGSMRNGARGPSRRGSVNSASETTRLYSGRRTVAARADHDDPSCRALAVVSARLRFSTARPRSATRCVCWLGATTWRSTSVIFSVAHEDCRTSPWHLSLDCRADSRRAQNGAHTGRGKSPPPRGSRRAQSGHPKRPLDGRLKPYERRCVQARKLEPGAPRRLREGARLRVPVQWELRDARRSGKHSRSCPRLRASPVTSCYDSLARGPKSPATSSDFLDTTRTPRDAQLRGVLQSSCNPNARSTMGFVGRRWETGLRFSLQMATVLVTACDQTPFSGPSWADPRGALSRR